MQLPCRHLFAVRSKLNLELCSSALCSERWTLDYYHRNHRILSDNYQDFGQSSLNLTKTSCRPVVILSQQEKYRKAFRLSQKLPSLVSEAPMREFEGRLATLKRLVQMWEQGTQVFLQDVMSATNAG